MPAANPHHQADNPHRADSPNRQDNPHRADSPNRQDNPHQPANPNRADNPNQQGSQSPVGKRWAQMPMVTEWSMSYVTILEHQ